ncbi:unnamed protein product, partial [marine sediment metagenome]
KEESFLWLSELGQPDPYFILVIIFVITSFLTQQMMLTDPSQKAIKYIMPIAMGFIFYRLAAALLVYFNTSNIWQLGERYIISRLFVFKISTTGFKIVNLVPSLHKNINFTFFH